MWRGGVCMKALGKWMYAVGAYIYWACKYLYYTEKAKFCKGYYGKE